MSRANLRGGDASINFPSSDADARDSGNLLDGMGSASSLGSSSSSSIFSANAQAVRSNGHLSSATPLTHPDSSPLKPLSPYPGLNGIKSNHQSAVAAKSPFAHTSAATPRGPSTDATPRQSPPVDRPQLRPPPGEAKGYRTVYDPELDSKLSDKERKKSVGRTKVRNFGTEVRLNNFYMPC